jgi:ectoine hydroxylase-related dioxygenase (phytanoyl-CoA dioxygenase family)
MMDTDFPTAPNFGAERDGHDLIGWDMDPGDILLFGPVISHGSEGNASNEYDRRALAFRYAGSDVTYAPCHATMPLLWEANVLREYEGLAAILPGRDAL